MNIIVVDVGNSNIKIGLFEAKKLVDVFVRPTKDVGSLILPPLWKKISPTCIGIASVVPSVNELLKKIFSTIYKGSILIVAPADCNLPLKVKNPDRVGVDRVLNCKAAIELFGSDVIVIDIGTAITVDYASEKGFMGGVIMPGPSLWMSSLSKTAMIKEIKKTRANIPGKDTAEAIYSGMRYGIVGAINSIVEVYRKRYPSVKVILTGGYSGWFSRDIKCDMKRRYLTLEGLGMVMYERCREGRNL